jgi:hypothetical protein
MTRRSDSKIDLDKYRPSPDTVRRVSDEAAAQERLRQALDNPGLDEALAELQGAAPAPEAPAAQAVDAVPAPAMGEPSPWAQGSGAAGLDAAALPSAMAPAVPPVTARIKASGRTPPRRRWTPVRTALAAIALAFLPAMIVFLLFVKPPQPPGAPRDAPPVATSIAAATATGRSAEPVTSARPASPGATSSASAEPAAPPSATGLPSATAPPRMRPRGTVDDPYDAAPPATAPGATSVPTAQPRPPPPGSAAPTPDSPFLRRRPE